MDDKIKQVKTLMNGECDDIAVHKVSADWYRHYVDMDYYGEHPLTIVQCSYNYELCAMPQYMTLTEFTNRTAESIAEKWEI